MIFGLGLVGFGIEGFVDCCSEDGEFLGEVELVCIVEDKVLFCFSFMLLGVFIVWVKLDFWVFGVELRLCWEERSLVLLVRSWFMC